MDFAHHKLNTNETPAQGNTANCRHTPVGPDTTISVVALFLLFGICRLSYLSPRLKTGLSYAKRAVSVRFSKYYFKRYIHISY